MLIFVRPSSLFVTHNALVNQHCILFRYFFSGRSVHGVRRPALQDVRREVLQFPRTVQVPVERGLRGPDVQHSGDERREKHEELGLDENHFSAGIRTVYFDRRKWAAAVGFAFYSDNFFRTDWRLKSELGRKQTDQNQRAESVGAVQEKQRAHHIEHERNRAGGNPDWCVHRLGWPRILGSFRTV